MPHKNAEDRRVWARDYYARTKDKTREHRNKLQKPINKKYRLKKENRDKIAKRAKAYRDENKEKVLEQSRKYWKEHKDELNARQRQLTAQSAPQYVKRQLRKNGFKNECLKKHPEIVETYQIIIQTNKL